MADFSTTASHTGPDVRLTAEQMACWQKRGFLALEAITTPEEVERLRGIFDRLFGERAGWKEGRSYDLAGTDEAGRAAALPQILNPVQFAPELADTTFRRNALDLARQLLGPTAEAWFEHAIDKPPRYGAATPWHQDEAHRDDPGTDYHQISIWMPLQEATVENGCMQYVPGSHCGSVLTHRSPNNDPRISALECIGEFDRSAAVACPLPPGGAAIHHCRTLHCAGPNQSGAARRAYILAFRSAAIPAPGQVMFPWIAEKRTAAAGRAEAWENRGGAIGRGFRRAEKFAKGMAARVCRRLKPK